MEAGDLVGLPFEEIYQRRLASWDVPAPQPAFVDLANAGRIHGKVLDLGCGTGELALFLAARGLDVVGLDFSRTAIAQAQTKATERGVTVRFVSGDAFDLDALGRRFDTVVDSGLFHVLSDDDRRRYVDGLRGIVRPGGHHYLLCFNEHATLPGPRRITKNELSAAFTDGWRFESITAARFDLVGGRPGADAWLASIARDDGVT